jgi:hypothetical protein
MIPRASSTKQVNFNLKTPIETLAKKYINKNPGIYKGNLIYWIKEAIPKATENETQLAFNQLIKKGYFFNICNCVYPPEKVDEDEKTLMRFVYKYNLSFLDFAILYELNKIGKSSKIGDLSRAVVDKNWHDNEAGVKIQIQKLFWKNIIQFKNGSIGVNWKLILGGIR